MDGERYEPDSRDLRGKGRGRERGREGRERGKEGERSTERGRGIPRKETPRKNQRPVIDVEKYNIKSKKTWISSWKWSLIILLNY